MYAHILYSYLCYLSSNITGKTLAFFASGLFIQNRINSWPGRNTRSLIDQFSSCYSHACETPAARTKLLNIPSGSRSIASFDLR